MFFALIVFGYLSMESLRFQFGDFIFKLIFRWFTSCIESPQSKYLNIYLSMESLKLQFGDFIFKLIIRLLILGDLPVVSNHHNQKIKILI